MPHICYIWDMTFEHFKTCVRAYFPNHDFSWIRYCRRHFHEPVCISEADIYNVAIQFDLLESPRGLPEDDEKALVRYLKQASRTPGINPDTLEFGGDMYLMQVTDEYRAIVLTLDEMSISTYPRTLPAF